MESLLEKSRKNNSSIGVTGLLISYQGLFIQYLEGEDATIDELYEKIRIDPRHRSVIEISSDILEDRQFSNWSMAYRKVDADKAEEILGYRDLNKKDLLVSERTDAQHPALQLLNSFLNNL